MTPEEFKRIKEAEKEHLRALKKLKQSVRTLERRKSVNDAVTDLASSTENILDEHTNLVEKLAQETALQEARLEIALESAALREEDAEEAEILAKAEAGNKEVTAKDEEELAKERASDLVKQMKRQMGGPELDDRLSANEPPTAEKSIGRPRKKDAGAEPSESKPVDKSEADVPEKTIGRMRKEK